MRHLISPLVAIWAICGIEASSSASGAHREQSHPDRSGQAVLLVHGIGDDARSMKRMARYLHSEGWDAHTLSLTPNRGEVGLDLLALQIDGYVEQTFATGRKIDLVGFSMGGLVCRYYVQRLGGLKRIRRLVTIATPHQGTRLACLLPNPAGRQMRPGSRFLRDLAMDAGQLAKVGFTSIWTPLDLVILPARSSAVSPARNVKLWVAFHPLMVIERRCLQALAAALGAQPIPAREAKKPSTISPRPKDEFIPVEVQA